MTAPSLHSSPAPPRFACWHECAWLLAIAAMGGIGIVQIFALWPAAQSVRSSGPMSAMELHAKFAAGAAGALAPLRLAIEPLPQDRSLRVYVKKSTDRRESDAADLAVQVVQYLAWPRPVEVITAAPGSDGKSLKDLAATCSAVVLCGYHGPKANPALTVIGPQLEILRLEQPKP